MAKMIYQILVNYKLSSLRRLPKRFYCQAKVKSNITACLEEVPKLSTLFVPGRHGADIYQIVKPVIDVNYIADNLENLKFSCDHRGIHLDLENVLSIAKKWLFIREQYFVAVERYQECVTELHRSAPVSDKDNFSVLDKKKNDCIAEIGAEKIKLHDIEDVVMPLFQKIPHILHADTPLELNVIEMCREPPIPRKEVSSHTSIAKNLLHFTSDPTSSYYMIGKLSDLELAIQQYFMTKLSNKEFSPLSCVDFCKSFIVEAIGHDPYSGIKIKEKSSRELGQKLHLVGGASFESFCSYLTNMNVNKSTLPMKYFSIGRRYNAENKGNNFLDLFSVVQSTNVHCLTLSHSPSFNMFDMLVQTIKDCYTEFNIPFRIINVAAKNLTIAESQRKQLELWSPSIKDYVPVAYVSQHDDFISKRLQITYGIEYIKEGYCHVVEGTFVNIPVLVGCIVENFQISDYDFSIPTVLKQYLFSQE